VCGECVAPTGLDVCDVGGRRVRAAVLRARSRQARRRVARQPAHLGARTRDGRGHNKAAVALANKLARIVWAVWRNEQPFAARKEEPTPTT
jgi:hypothetical protein